MIQHWIGVVMAAARTRRYLVGERSPARRLTQRRRGHFTKARLSCWVEVEELACEDPVQTAAALVAPSRLMQAPQTVG